MFVLICTTNQKVIDINGVMNEIKKHLNYESLKCLCGILQAE